MVLSSNTFRNVSDAINVHLKILPYYVSGTGKLIGISLTDQLPLH